MNLNISNYNRTDLQELFDLQRDYNEMDVEFKAQELKDRILSRTNVPIEIKNDTVDFISQAKEILIDEQKNPLKLATINAKNPDAIKNGNQYQFYHAENMYPKTLNSPSSSMPGLTIVIDTRFRPNYYITQCTNFTVNLPYKLRGVTSVSLSGVNMEDALFNNVSKEYGNNYFWIRAYGPDYNPSLDPNIKVNNAMQPTQYEETMVHVTDGAFSVDNMIAIINNYLQNLTHTNYLQYIYLTGNTSYSGGTTYQMIFAISTAYYTANSLGPSSEVIHSTPDFTFELDFQLDTNGNPDYFTPLPSKLGWSLGFRNGKYINNTTYLSEGTPTTLGPRYFYLCMDDGQVNYNTSIMNAFSNSMIAGNSFGKIDAPSTRSTVSNVQQFLKISGSRSYNGPVDLEKLKFQLKDEFGRISPGYNVDMSITLTVSFGSLGSISDK